MSGPPGFQEAALRFREAAEAAKCWPCGCLAGSLDAVERALLPEAIPGPLAAAMRDARARLEPARYDCLGCPTCWPALAVNSLQEAGVAIEDGCPTEEVSARTGWPPLPGDYQALRFRAPVAVCTLTDRELALKVARQAGPEVAIAGTLATENLGIERVIANLLANPHLRFLVLCGADSRQRVGHLPGASFLALAASGTDERGRIVGAPGKRPWLRNLSRAAVERFRERVELVDRVGSTDVGAILDSARALSLRDPGPAEPFPGEPGPEVVPGRLPERVVLDPAGYFVVHVDRRRGLLALEHYREEGGGLLDAIVEGESAAEVYTPAIERGLVSRLDHAAYLGRELARAERALREGSPYVQDGAPEREPAAPAARKCQCGPTCGEGPPDGQGD